MPVIGIPLDLLRQGLGSELAGDRLLRVLEEIGCDVEGFARLKRTRCRACGWIEERTETEEPPAIRFDRYASDEKSLTVEAWWFQIARDVSNEDRKAATGILR